MRSCNLLWEKWFPQNIPSCPRQIDAAQHGVVEGERVGVVVDGLLVGLNVADPTDDL
jgi:hypothetical protein